MRLALSTLGGLWTWMKIDKDNVDVLEGSSAPMDQTLTCLHETMVKITAECTAGASIELYDHETSLFQGVASNIHHLRLARINKSMHPRMVFH
jgi:hypothetical protein